jgi:hypothetical protein
MEGDRLSQSDRDKELGPAMDRGETMKKEGVLTEQGRAGRLEAR